MPIRQSALFLYAFALFGLSISSILALEVKIGLEDSSIRNYISANKNYGIFELKDSELEQKLMQRVAKQETLLRFAKATANKLVIASEPDLATSSKTLLFSCNIKDPRHSDSDCIWNIRDAKASKNIKRYRGLLLIEPKTTSYTLVNKLDIEDYLKGVVPSEMPASWQTEALKAQSVAARTYTLSKLNRRKNLGYDLKPSVEDQVYLGVNHEDSRANAAIKASSGLVLMDKQKKPVEAYFFSQAGSSTATASDVWGLEPHSYLRPQLIADNTKFWQKNFSHTQLQTKLADLKLGNIDAINILNRTAEGRAKDILVSSGNKHIKLSGEELRHKLGLRSTLFNIETTYTNISFIGQGFGHGIGMSQYGAQHLAKKGKNFKEILRFFYEGADLVKI